MNRDSETTVRPPAALVSGHRHTARRLSARTATGRTRLQRLRGAPPPLWARGETTEPVGTTHRPPRVMVRPRVKRPGAGSGAPSTTSPPAPRKFVDGLPAQTMTQTDTVHAEFDVVIPRRALKVQSGASGQAHSCRRLEHQNVYLRYVKSSLAFRRGITNKKGGLRKCCSV
jgi:hypothetical protein